MALDKRQRLDKGGAAAAATGNCAMSKRRWME